MTGVTGDELAVLAVEIHLQPAFANEICYIASGPEHEILAVKRDDGLFDVQLLEKSQAAIAVDETIRVFQQFVEHHSPVCPVKLTPPVS